MSNLRLFYNLRHLINFSTYKHYYNNYIQPYLFYGVHLYYLLTPIALKNPLFLLQKKALRLVSQNLSKSNTNKLLSTSVISSKTNTLILPFLAQYSSCLMAYYIKTAKCPSYLTSTFKPSRTKNTRYQHKLPSSLQDNRLYLHIVSSFNHLPDKLHRLPPRSFKIKLKDYLSSTY